jgi:hypothetical protein
VLFRPKFGLKNTSYDPNVVIDRNVKNNLTKVSYILLFCTHKVHLVHDMLSQEIERNNVSPGGGDVKEQEKEKSVSEKEVGEIR